MLDEGALTQHIPVPVQVYSPFNKPPPIEMNTGHVLVLRFVRLDQFSMVRIGSSCRGFLLFLLATRKKRATTKRLLVVVRGPADREMHACTHARTHCTLRRAGILYLTLTRTTVSRSSRSRRAYLCVCTLCMGVCVCQRCIERKHDPACHPARSLSISFSLAVCVYLFLFCSCRHPIHHCLHCPHHPHHPRHPHQRNQAKSHKRKPASGTTRVGERSRSLR